MAWFPEDLGEDRAARREERERWIQVAEEEQISEGDISVSETTDGREPLPTLDGRALDDDPLEDDLTALDEDDPELGFSRDPVDHYLADAPDPDDTEGNGEDEDNPPDGTDQA
ncbi:MAG: hypothetical protein SF162_11420 [bacterium]|nr:hypothetical protein [bacterium]